MSINTGRQLAVSYSVCILAILITRLPLMPSHLFSFDAVGLALALEEFDPARYQPQPPGYPLFVMEARLFYWILGSPELTFSTLCIFIGGLSVGMLYLLGRQIFSAWIGLVAAALLFVNPVFWFSTLTSPLRLHLALISIITAYCCWRASNGEKRFFYLASIAIGFGGGFRPELTLVLLPLWGWTAWKCGSLRLLLQGGYLLAGGTFVWIAILFASTGGFASVLGMFGDYFVAQTRQTSPLLNAPETGWRHMAGRAIVWNGLGTLCWIWAIPFGWLSRRDLEGWQRYANFLAMWFFPPFIFSLLVHIGDPDHALASIPPLCLAGAFCLVKAEETITRRWIPHFKEGLGFLLGWMILLINLPLFFSDLPLFVSEFVPLQREKVSRFRGISSVADAFLFGTFESSYPRIRGDERQTTLALEQIERLRDVSDRPLLVISGYAEPAWRKISFYLPSENVYALEEQGNPGVQVTVARLWLGNKVLAEYRGPAPIQLPVPKMARLVWVISGQEAEELSRNIAIQPALPVFYTDLSPDAPSFRVGSFEFVPQ